MKTLALLALTLAACGSSSPSETIDPGNLTGMISGQAWSFVAGSTDSFLSEGQDDFFAVMYPTQYTACGSEPTGPHLIVAVPKVAGTYEMSLSRNMTFVDASDNNKIATQGKVEVDNVSATSLTGGLVGTFDDQDEVSGHFTLTVCPPQS